MTHIDIEIEFIKSDKTVTMVTNLNCPSYQLCIALKEICIFLKVKSNDTSEFTSDKQGHLKFNVNNYKEELKGDLYYYAKMLLYPDKQVRMNTSGFSFEEIKSIMQAFYDSIPNETMRTFFYDINFKKLKLGK